MTRLQRSTHVQVRWPRRQAEKVEKALAAAVVGKPGTHAEQRALTELRNALRDPQGGQ